jgi:hypothetical protein
VPQFVPVDGRAKQTPYRHRLTGGLVQQGLSVAGDVYDSNRFGRATDKRYSLGIGISQFLALTRNEYMPSPLLPYLPSAVREQIGQICPDLVPDLLAALESISTHTPSTARVLESTLKAVSSHRVPVYETASYILGDLASFDTRATASLLNLSRSQDARVRHNALLCLREETPNAVTLEMITLALTDASSRVRRKAADWAGRLKLHAALPAIKQALDKEIHAETRAVMAFEVGRFSDGTYSKKGADA